MSNQEEKCSVTATHEIKSEEVPDDSDNGLDKNLCNVEVEDGFVSSNHDVGHCGPEVNLTNVKQEVEEDTVEKHAVPCTDSESPCDGNGSSSGVNQTSGGAKELLTSSHDVVRCGPEVSLKNVKQEVEEDIVPYTNTESQCDGNASSSGVKQTSKGAKKSVQQHGSAPPESGLSKLKRRRIGGEYHHHFQELKTDPERFHSYLKMSVSTFNYILSKIEPRITKTWCNFHDPILPEERLVVTLRLLLTGSSYKSLSSTFGMGASTVAKIVSETINFLWEELQPLHMPAPSQEMFKSIADEFSKVWNFPNCIGALDGKHFRVRCSGMSGSMVHNYKKCISFVLQAVVDAKYRFLMVDVGDYGSQSDGGTFQTSDICHAIKSGKLNIPKPTVIPGTNIDLPFVFVASETYPLLNCLLKPFSGSKLSLEEKGFNKRLSGSSKTVECAFGILVSKWHILNKAIEAKAEFADRILRCVCVLHNLIIDTDGMDENTTEVSCDKCSVVWDRSGRPSDRAKCVRDIFTAHLAKNPLACEET